MMLNCDTILFLDLAEVMSVTQVPPIPGPPKKTDDKSFFDVSSILYQIKLHVKIMSYV